MIEQLKQRFHPSYTVLAGHSGGAAITGDLLGRRLHALSPQELAVEVSPAVHVSVLVGANDDVAPASMSKGYAEALKKRVNNVTLTIAPEAGHEVLLEPVTHETLTSLVESLRRSGP